MKDAMYHQQQVILRNNGGPASAAWEFLRLGWFWRKLARSPMIRNLPLALTALMNLAIFSVASVFSSEVAKAPGNETLVRDSICGWWSPGEVPQEFNDMKGKDMFDYQTQYLRNSIAAASYARACYTNSESILDCNRYAVPRIKWYVSMVVHLKTILRRLRRTVNANASCPFASGRCLMGDNAAYEMDTGPIDSHHILGLNAPKKDRVTYRKKTTCAPFSTEGLYRLENATDPVAAQRGDQFVRYYLGPNMRSGNNYTFEYSFHKYLGNSGYTLK